MKGHRSLDTSHPSPKTFPAKNERERFLWQNTSLVFGLNARHRLPDAVLVVVESKKRRKCDEAKCQHDILQAKA